MAKLPLYIIVANMGDYYDRVGGLSTSLESAKRKLNHLQNSVNWADIPMQICQLDSEPED